MTFGLPCLSVFLPHFSDTNDNEELIWINTTGSSQTYYLWVTAATGVINHYDLHIDILSTSCTDDNYEPNDSALFGYATGMENVTIPINTEISLIQCGDFDTFAFTAIKGQIITIEEKFAQSASTGQ